MTIPSRRNYDRVEEEEDSSLLLEEQPLPSGDETTKANTAAPNTTTTIQSLVVPLDSSDDEDSDENTMDKEDTITVVVLDAAQSRFKISANPNWTILQFKQRSKSIHKVAAPSQRLIYRGKLLQDDTTLQEAGIFEDDVIIHLFPKPNVVITSTTTNKRSDNSNSNSNNSDSNPEVDSGGGGAHVPRIVMDAEEADRRSQILVLSSEEMYEAQHWIRMLSFLLLMISSLEIMQLLTILLGNQQDDRDNYATNQDDHDHTPPMNPTDPTDSNANENTMRDWQGSDYFDLAVSILGFYASTLGIKASSELSRALAKQYMFVLVLSGIAWNAFYCYSSVQIAEATQDEEKHESYESSDDQSSEYEDTSATEVIFTVSFFLTILMPICMWALCFLRAFQFHELIRDAEEEAEERTRNDDLQMDEEQQQQTGGNHQINGEEDDHEFTMQNRGASLT